VSYYISFLLFAVVAYLVLTDQSVASAFYYVMKLIKIEYQKRKWMLLNDPRNPIVKYLIWRRSYKLAKELQRELESNAK
jgi:predicted transcriptional regulator